MNPREHFEPSFRNQFWWASDSAQAVRGRANEVVMQKIGMMPPPDLSGVEKVQMGHVMEPVALRLAEEKLKTQVASVEGYKVHRRESWLASHTDGQTTLDGQEVLIECKNVNENQMRYFGDEWSSDVPPYYLAQCIHEAACFDVDRVYMSVIFGGQQHRMYTLDINSDQKSELIKKMAEYWGCVVAKNPLPPETPDQARLLFNKENGSEVIATSHIEQLYAELVHAKANISKWEEIEENAKAKIMSHLGNGAKLVSVDGSTLVTWSQSKSSKRFNPELFKQAYPDLYNSFVVEVPGSRRFLVK